MYDHIVIPVDGSDEAERAAAHGLELAHAFDASVDVVHVVDDSSLDLATTADEETTLREGGAAILAAVDELAREGGPHVTSTVLEGKPAVRIVEYVGERDADLIVLGRQGRSSLGKRLFGGVTEQVLHRSDVPVLVVPAGDRTTKPAGYDHVLVPTDGSENAAVATPHGVAIARRYGSTVHALNVVDLQDAGGPFDAGGLQRSFVERLESRGEDAVDGIAGEIDETAPDLDVETAVRTTSAQGTAAGIREYVRDRGVGLVVLGSHGRSNLRRQLLGSVTSNLLRTVDVPVLVVHRPS